jgi:hypothetical protein
MTTRADVTRDEDERVKRRAHVAGLALEAVRYVIHQRGYDVTLHPSELRRLIIDAFVAMTGSAMTEALLHDEQRESMHRCCVAGLDHLAAVVASYRPLRSGTH